MAWLLILFSHLTSTLLQLPFYSGFLDRSVSSNDTLFCTFTKFDNFPSCKASITCAHCLLHHLCLFSSKKMSEMRVISWMQNKHSATLPLAQCTADPLCACLAAWLPVCLPTSQLACCKWPLLKKNWNYLYEAQGFSHRRYVTRRNIRLTLPLGACMSRSVAVLKKHMLCMFRSSFFSIVIQLTITIYIYNYIYNLQLDIQFTITKVKKLKSCKKLHVKTMEFGLCVAKKNTRKKSRLRIIPPWTVPFFIPFRPLLVLLAYLAL